jgi:hypothetical protein
MFAVEDVFVEGDVRVALANVVLFGEYVLAKRDK